MNILYSYLLSALMSLGVLANTQTSVEEHVHSDTTNKNKPASPESPPSPAEDKRIPVTVPIEQQDRIGLKIARVEKRKVAHTIRTVGMITTDQTLESQVHTKVNGWIEKVYADSVGKPVKKGDPLFDLYSPDLVTTKEEYSRARKQGASVQGIAKAALDRLRLWGVPPAEIDQLQTSGTVKRSTTFVSPVDGVITNKKAVQGTYITADMELYKIVDLSHLWIIITLYESDVAIASVGDEVNIHLPYDQSVHLKGKISYIYPEIEIETRAGKARIDIDNKDMKLKPGMFVNVELSKDLGMSLLIPEDAVIDTGARKIVFVKSETASPTNSKFDPREVTVGQRVNHEIVILSGLNEGEEVVAGAHFLIDAESKIQAALQKGVASSSGHAGHGKEGNQK